MKITNKTFMSLDDTEYNKLEQATNILQSIYNGLSNYNLSVGRFSTEDIMKIITNIEDLVTAITNYDYTDEEEF